MMTRSWGCVVCTTSSRIPMTSKWPGGWPGSTGAMAMPPCRRALRGRYGLRATPHAESLSAGGGGGGRARLGTPSWGGDNAGFHQLKAVEEASDPSRAAQVVGRVGGLVPDARGLHHLLAGVGAVIHRQVTPGGHTA